MSKAKSICVQVIIACWKEAEYEFEKNSGSTERYQ